MFVYTHVILLSALIEFIPLELNVDISGLLDGMATQQNQTHCTMLMSNFGYSDSWMYYKWCCIRNVCQQKFSMVIDMSSILLWSEVQIPYLHWLYRKKFTFLSVSLLFGLRLIGYSAF